MPGVDFRGTAGEEGKGIVTADGFSTADGVKTPSVVLTGTVTFNPPSLATGVYATSSNIAIAGIQLGDAIELFPPYATQGIMYQATPASAGNMVINLFNAGASTVDLASGAWGYAVKRRV